ncbi:hypothetical protein ACMU_05660 [Actibacterium mucosum KCTC 23349]|uniref:Acyltransferase 3 domain-containing protein n=1 Tax=Actibacterium mucosum KCTC 23349 TaxID=1454373 RepID=A0A037ZJ50_9RHOB|nr:acyltransferase [Actibacterium mucosum]KAJ56430.1 hypothetical protein ACMU_05660 [Actibacterium mucosum KCTC 23349]
MTEQVRMVWLDALRLIAGVSMVGLHATADSMGQPFAAFETSERIAPMLLRAVIYTARTELFLIISVFLLLLALETRPKTYAAVMRIQARRLLVPFAFWTLFYAAYNLIKAETFGYAAPYIDQLSKPFEWFGFFLLGDVKYHMHFIPTLFGLLLFYPLFRLAQQFPMIGLMVLACLAAKREMDVFVWSTFWGQEGLPYLVRGVKILTYCGYGMVAGAALGIWQQVEPAVRRQWFVLIAFVGAMLFLIKLIATYKTIETAQWQHGFTPGYWADFLMPVVLFMGCLCLGHLRWPSVISKWAPYSFGIYLCHPIFLDVSEILLRGTAWPPIAQVGFKIAVAIPLTTALVVLLSRNSVLGWTVGMGHLPRVPGFNKLKVKGI